ncbi:pectate lyase a [Moniliophthora roreri]|nr:pectate lyase a [Moniliophthora roreri]
MKWLASIFAVFAAQAVMASPLEKRASVNDVATIGYATLNGGLVFLYYCDLGLTQSLRTTGGSGGTQTTVSTLDALTSAVSGDAKKIVLISGTITGNTVVKVGPNTTVIGQSGSQLVGVGLRVLEVSNVIIRNVKISKVLADAGDAIGVQSASQVWIDHADLSSDRDHDKDFELYKASDGLRVRLIAMMVFWTLLMAAPVLLSPTASSIITGRFGEMRTFHTPRSLRPQASLVGHSDSNGDEDTKITVTYVGNYWSNLNSRTPSFRFGHGHIFNNYFEDNSDGINTRDGAQLLVENNVWVDPKKPLYSTDEGFAISKNNDFGGGEDTAPTGDFNTAPYSYSMLATGSVVSSVTATAGQTLSF